MKSGYLLLVLLVFGIISADGRGLYKIGATPPVLLRFVVPQPPAPAHQPGRVVVWTVVEADGTVSDARIKEAGGADFGSAAAAAVRKWVFSPALWNGKPVPVAIEILLSFDGESPEITADLSHLAN
jgi:protein TonB